jgi:DNA-binding NarL/FixJ family response regulator
MTVINWDNGADANILDGCVVVVLASNVSAVGASGPSTQIAELSAAVQAVVQRSFYLPPPTEQRSIATVKAPAGSTAVSLDAFTARQRDVLRLIVKSMSNKEIARALNLGEGTVKVHMAALFRKLRVNRRAAVAVVGARLLTEMAA